MAAPPPSRLPKLGAEIGMICYLVFEAHAALCWSVCVEKRRNLKQTADIWD